MADVRSGLDPKDYKFINDKPDPDFSPERNMAVFNETVKETAQFFLKQYDEMNKEMEDRIDILSSFAVHNFNKDSKTLEKYIGRQHFEALIGERLLRKIRVAESVNRLNGNTKFKKGILL